MGMQTPVSLVIYVVLILLFTFFYTKLQVDPEKIAENLGKSGTYIPGIRPGTETKEYVNKVLCNGYWWNRNHHRCRCGNGNGKTDRGTPDTEILPRIPAEIKR